MMGPMPDVVTPLLWIAALAVPLAAWKAIEIIVWVFSHLQWVTP